MASSEYIPREAALALVEPDARPFLAERISQIPAADVRPVRRGKWIDHQEDRWIYAKCSECGTVHDVNSNFCPNCGADMREEAE